MFEIQVLGKDRHISVAGVKPTNGIPTLLAFLYTAKYDVHTTYKLKSVTHSTLNFWYIVLVFDNVYTGNYDVLHDVY